VARRKHKDKKGDKMSTTKIDSIVNYLTTNAKLLKYGFVSATLQIHDGRLVNINYETKVTIKEREEVKE